MGRKIRYFSAMVSDFDDADALAAVRMQAAARGQRARSALAAARAAQAQRSRVQNVLAPGVSWQCSACGSGVAVCDCWCVERHSWKLYQPVRETKNARNCCAAIELAHCVCGGAPDDSCIDCNSLQPHANVEAAVRRMCSAKVPVLRCEHGGSCIGQPH